MRVSGERSPSKVGCALKCDEAMMQGSERGALDIGSGSGVSGDDEGKALSLAAQILSAFDTIIHQNLNIN